MYQYTMDNEVSSKVNSELIFQAVSKIINDAEVKEECSDDDKNFQENLTELELQKQLFNTQQQNALQVFDITYATQIKQKMIELEEQIKNLRDEHDKLIEEKEHQRKLKSDENKINGLNDFFSQLSEDEMNNLFRDPKLKEKLGQNVFEYFSSFNGQK